MMGAMNCCSAVAISPSIVLAFAELAVPIWTVFESDGRLFVPDSPVYSLTFPTVLQFLEKLLSGAERMTGWT